MDDTEIKRPEDVWPEAQTAVYVPPAPPVGETIVTPPPDRRIGAGMLIAILVVLLVAGIGLAWYLTHRSSTSATNTVTVTTSNRRAAVAPAGTKKAAGQTTTAPATTTAPTTTAPPQPASSTVPDVSRQPEAAAVQALGQAGILASLAFVPARDELGTVEAQAKPAGTTLPFHSHLQINLSTGPGQKPSEQVPNVIGQPLQQALAAINGAHLRLLYLRFPVTSPSEAGKVVQQSPLGGGTAPQNAQVVVYLGALNRQ